METISEKNLIEERSQRGREPKAYTEQGSCYLNFYLVHGFLVPISQQNLLVYNKHYLYKRT